MTSEFCLFDTQSKRVIWEITRRCNYHCKHCCSRAGAVNVQDGISTTRALELLEEMHNAGIKSIYISGGEPFIRPDIFQILEYAQKYNFEVNISTNGSLLTDSFVEKLKCSSIRKIHISLDSIFEDDFNFFRGGNYYKQTLSSIDKIVNASLYLRVGIVLWKRNLSQIESMITFLANKHVNEVVFNWPIRVGRLADNDDLIPPYDSFVETTKLIRSLQQKFWGKILISMHRNKEFLASSHSCPAGEDIFYINSEGILSVCSWLAKLNYALPQFSLKNNSFTELIKKTEFITFRHQIHERELKFGSGCPAMCIEKSGNFYSIDPLLIC